MLPSINIDTSSANQKWNASMQKETETRITIIIFTQKNVEM